MTISNTQTEELPQVELPRSLVRPQNKKISKRKLDYATKLRKLLDEYDTCLIISVHNVQSSQIDYFRKKLRGVALFLFGKNTLMRKIIREYMKEKGNRKLLPLLDLIKGNSGLVFTKGNVGDLRKELTSTYVARPAKAGQVAPVDVYVPAGPTGIEPRETFFFLSLDIPTRIKNGQINVLEEKRIIRQGDKITLTQATLLSKLNIKPFYYGVEVTGIYEDGESCNHICCCGPTHEDIAQMFYMGLRNVASLCASINYPTIVSVPFSIIKTYRHIVALGLSFKSYTWPNLELVKDICENPEKFANIGGQWHDEPCVEEETDAPESVYGGANIFEYDSSSDE